MTLRDPVTGRFVTGSALCASCSSPTRDPSFVLCGACAADDLAEEGQAWGDYDSGTIVGDPFVAPEPMWAQRVWAEFKNGMAAYGEILAWSLLGFCVGCAVWAIVGAVG